MYTLIGGAIIAIGLTIAALVGYVMNIVQLVQTPAAEFGTMEIVRIIAIFVAPVGCVLGYF